MADGNSDQDDTKKPDTNAGLIANIFQGSIMRIPDQDSHARSVHKVTQERKIGKIRQPRMGVD